jgi:hypothetical protein
MDGELSWVPADIDLNRPNAARIYDYLLGGSNNFGVDREFAKQVLATVPDARTQVRQNRSFLRRAVTYLVEQGVRQFLDLGSGIPTVGNTHDVAQRLAPGSRVLYVDNEPVAVAHSELLLQDNPDADILRADVTVPKSVLDNPKATELLDFGQPVAVLMCAVVHYLADEADPWSVVAGYRDATVAGSYLVISHTTADDRPEMSDAADQYRRSADNNPTERPLAKVRQFFDGYQLVEPGLVPAPRWRPEVEEVPVTGSLYYGGVGRKR